ncbi:MAG TPA: ABC transporter permease [Ktedonobacteraceae bacterium]|nr:ABC transporter permease [Ktedonobacteraceae bacterium]
MIAPLVVLLGSFRAELLQIFRSRLFVALTAVLAVTFLFLVSLFGLTGSRAPTAIVTEDHGTYAREFIAQLAETHHSFDIRPMDQASALAALHSGKLVAIITLPQDFSYAIAHGQQTSLRVAVDNVNTDMTDDIQRALPSAIVAFGRQLKLPDIRLQVTEIDLIDHDTGFIPYMIVSGLALDAFVIAGILSAMAVAREYETGTIKMLAVAPVHPLLSIMGRVFATATISCAAMVFPVALAIFGFNIKPLYPFEMVGVILLCIALFSCIGVALGALLKRTLPVCSLIFGLALPLYLMSGSLEPQRFDGNLIWIVAHVSPVYYPVGLLEQAFHGLQVTPEPVCVDFVALLGWAAATLVLAAIFLRNALVEKAAIQQVPKEQKRDHEYQPLVRRGYWLWQESGFVLLARNWPLLTLVLALVFGGIWFRIQQNPHIDSVRHQQQPAVSNAADQQRDTLLLNNYMEKISALLTQHNLLHAKATDPVAIIADTLTRETLQQLSPQRKAALLQYLYNTKLIDDEFHVVSLSGADFHSGLFAGIDLSDTNLTGANFSASDMRNVDLRFTTLVGVNFSGANLTGADLSGADMHNVDVSGANLAGANLMGVTGISLEQLIQARSLAGTTLPNGSVQPTVENDSN